MLTRASPVPTGEDVEAVAEKLENQTAATQAMREQLEAQSAELAAARASKNELATEVASLRAEKEAVSNAQARQQGTGTLGAGLGPAGGSGIKRTTGSGRLARVSAMIGVLISYMCCGYRQSVMLISTHLRVDYSLCMQAFRVCKATARLACVYIDSKPLLGTAWLGHPTEYAAACIIPSFDDA
jgi:hypothetical protein